MKRRRWGGEERRSREVGKMMDRRHDAGLPASCSWDEELRIEEEGHVGLWTVGPGLQGQIINYQCKGGQKIKHQVKEGKK
jgi:hypothetical protein